MTRQIIDLSTGGGTGLGTDLRSGGAMINANFTELYAQLSETVNAASYSGPSTEARINAAITDATGRGLSRVFVPATMNPYDATAIGFNTTVQMVREGGAWDVYDVQAYGAAGDNVTNDATAIQAAINAAQVLGGRVYFPQPLVRYSIGATTLFITVRGVVFEASTPSVYLTYTGTGYGVNFGTVGASQLTGCGIFYLGVVCTNAAGCAIYAKSPYGFFIHRVYCENGITGTTGVGITIDGGLSSGGTGYYATQVIITQSRCSAFNKGILFKGGSLSGWDITTASSVTDCFVNGLSGNTGSVGIEFQGSNQCRVMGGNLEVLDRGVKLTSTPNFCAGVTLDTVRFENIAVANWDIPADAVQTTIINPRWGVDNGVDLAADTVYLQTNKAALPNHEELRYNRILITVANGNNNHTLAIGKKSYIVLSGATLPFAIGGFSGGGAAIDGKVITVISNSVQAMTINNADGSATANCGIRTGTGANVTIGAGADTTAATFVYNADYFQWVMLGHQP